tara:strand:- start:210 stop:413 length:204 start_codon:yes stop_codon:yes gene_type:complete
MRDLKKNQLQKITNIVQHSSEKESIKELILELIDYEQYVGSTFNDLRSFKDAYNKYISKAAKIDNDN